MRSAAVARLLAADKVGVAILHVPIIKPLYTEMILREARRTGRMVVVAENHSVIGGLGEAVTTTFLAAGALPTLHARYRISTNVMADTIKGGLRSAARRTSLRLNISTFDCSRRVCMMQVGKRHRHHDRAGNRKLTLFRIKRPTLRTRRIPGAMSWSTPPLKALFAVFR